MPRKFDADACRHYGWEPGSLLRFEDDRGYTRYYVLTAIGWRSILVRDVYGSVDDAGLLTLKAVRCEREMSGSLYRYAIRKIGNMDLNTGAWSLIEGTPEYEKMQSKQGATQ